MHSLVGALHCDSTARPYKIGVVDERGIAKYNATFCTVTTVNQFLTFSMLVLRVFHLYPDCLIFVSIITIFDITISNIVKYIIVYYRYIQYTIVIY